MEPTQLTYCIGLEPIDEERKLFIPLVLTLRGPKVIDTKRLDPQPLHLALNKIRELGAEKWILNR